MNVNGKTVYRVEVERRHTATFLVLADELADGLSSRDWDDVGTDTFVYAITTPPTDRPRVWTGGPDGDWESWLDLAEAKP